MDSHFQHMVHLLGCWAWGTALCEDLRSQSASASIVPPFALVMFLWLICIHPNALLGWPHGRLPSCRVPAYAGELGLGGVGGRFVRRISRLPEWSAAIAGDIINTLGWKRGRYGGGWRPGLGASVCHSNSIIEGFYERIFGPLEACKV